MAEIENKSKVKNINAGTKVGHDGCSYDKVVNRIVTTATSGLLYQHWKELGWQLCVDESQIKQWEDDLSDGTYNLNQTLVNVITAWVFANADGGTLGQLICHLRIIVWNDSADQLRTEFNVNEDDLEKIRSEMRVTGIDLNFIVNGIFTTATSSLFLGQWTDLARKLDITGDQMSQIRRMRRVSGKEILRTIISNWKMNKGNNATFENLIESLKQMKWIDSAENLKNMTLPKTEQMQCD